MTRGQLNALDVVGKLLLGALAEQAECLIPGGVYGKRLLRVLLERNLPRANEQVKLFGVGNMAEREMKVKLLGCRSKFMIEHRVPLFR